MKNKSQRLFIVLICIGVLVFLLSLFFLIIGDELDRAFNVIGIRIATLFVAFVSFFSTSTFSYLVYSHNRTVSRVNDDANQRAELFRELQFASSNYSIIEFYDRIEIYPESDRYIEKFIGNQSLEFHMFEESINCEKVLAKPEQYRYLTLRLPYRVVEGKVVSKISFERLKFERSGKVYRFKSPNTSSQAFLLYNDLTKRNEAIINLIIAQDSDFLNNEKDNEFTKIKINVLITSILGVVAKGINELYFTSPEINKENGTNLYKINSSNFTLIAIPQLEKLFHEMNNE